MRVPKQFELSLDSDAFNALKSDFNQMLKKTLHNMQEKGSENAELKISMKIHFCKGEEPDIRVDDFNGTRELIIPTFDHKVSSVLQIKDECIGSLGGNKYELVINPITKNFVIREIVNPQQVTLFDDWEEA